MTKRTGRTIRAMALSSTALALASPSLALAQQGGDAPPIATVDSIIVTGTRGVRTVADSLAPIDVIGEKELARTGQTDLRRALEELVPSYATSQGNSAGTGKAVKSGSLRGLGGNHVLVLVNGKRRHVSALTGGGAATGQSPADLNFIPTSAVARIEVLRDGAAAQYGSDAIAGVINVILKDNSEGGSASIGYGQYGKGPGGIGEQGKTKTLQLNQGLKLGEDGGSLSLSFEAQDQGNTNFTGPYRDNFLLYPRINGQYDPREFGQSRYRQVWGQPSVENYTASYNLNLPIGGGTSLYSFGTVGRRISAVNGGYRAPTNPLVITEIYPDGYQSKLQVKQADYQVVAGAKGNDIAGWDWDISTSYGRDNAKLHVLDALNASLGPTAPTRYYNGRQIFSEWTTNLDLTRSVQHAWAEEPLFVSVGTEFRRSTYAQKAGEFASWGDGRWVHPTGSSAGQVLNPGVAFQAGFRPDEAGSWSRHNTSLYLDLAQKLNKEWEVGAAARLEDYSDVGFVRSGKLSARWQAAPRWALRSTISNGFRAPSLQQSYNQNSQALWQTNPVTAEQQQVIQRNTTTSDPAAIALGAKPLAPEKSNNFSFGVVSNPLENLNISADFYQIDIKNRIQLSSSLNGTANATVRQLLLASGFNPGQDISYYANVGDTRTRGVDIVVDYLTRFGTAGDVKWTLASSLKKQEITRLNSQLGSTGVQVIGRDRQSLFTEAFPENVTSLTAQWTRNPWELTLRGTYYSSVWVRNATAANRDEQVKAAFIVNGSVGYAFRKDLKLIVGATNLFNRKPEQIPDAALPFQTTTRPYYSQQSPYGYDGRYVYARLEAAW